MKVIGKDESVMSTVTCMNCGAILQYKKSEVKEYHGTDYGGGPDGREWVICPECSEEVTIRSW